MDWTTLTGFEWDDGNTTKNQEKHGIGCTEAESVFLASDLRVLEDAKHSTLHETHYHAFGTSALKRLLSITFTIRASFIRIISARPMNTRERKFHGYS